MLDTGYQRFRPKTKHHVQPCAFPGVPVSSTCVTPKRKDTAEMTCGYYRPVVTLQLISSGPGDTLEAACFTSKYLRKSLSAVTPVSLSRTRPRGLVPPKRHPFERVTPEVNPGTGGHTRGRVQMAGESLVSFGRTCCCRTFRGRQVRRGAGGWRGHT